MQHLTTAAPPFFGQCSEPLLQLVIAIGGRLLPKRALCDSPSTRRVRPEGICFRLSVALFYYDGPNAIVTPLGAKLKLSPVWFADIRITTPFEFLIAVPLTPPATATPALKAVYIPWKSVTFVR